MLNPRDSKVQAKIVLTGCHVSWYPPKHVLCPHPKWCVSIEQISYQSEVLTGAVCVLNLVVIRQGLGTLGWHQRFWHRPGRHRDLSSTERYDGSFGQSSSSSIRGWCYPERIPAALAAVASQKTALIV